MNETFAQIFRHERTNKKLRLRDISENVGKSIGYLSDIEHGRRLPPSLDIVAKMESCLSVFDGRLVALANKERKYIARKTLRKLIQRESVFEFLNRADEFTDAEIRAFLSGKR